MRRADKHPVEVLQCVMCCLNTAYHLGALGVGVGLEDERFSLSSSMRRAVCGRCLLSNTLVTRRFSTRAVLLYQGDQRGGGHRDQGGGPPAVSLLPSLHTYQWQWMPGSTPTASSRCVTPLSSCSQTANAPLTYDHLSRVRQPLQRVHRATSHTAVRAQVTRVARDREGARSP
jgi:hypothetical protein